VSDPPRITLGPLPEQPRVTVIIPAFNAGRFVADAIASVRCSAYPEWSCVVVDDGSVDDTVDRAAAAIDGDPRCTLLRQANAGHVSAINRACATVDGELVALLDSDDLFLPDKLEVAISWLRDRPAAGLLTHRLFVTDDRLRIVGVMPIAGELPHGDLRPNLRRSASGDARLGVTSGMVMRREVFDLMFPADPGIGQFSDELVRRIAPLAADVTTYNRPLGLRRTHGRNQSDRSAGDLRRFLCASLTSYHHVRHAQEGAAARLGFDLPRDDLDLSLTSAVVARLEATADARARCRRVVRSDAFQVLGAGRQLFWRLALRLPRRLLATAVRQFCGVTNAKLVLNRWSLRRLQRRGVVGADLPKPVLGAGALVGSAARAVWQGASAPARCA
jgi:glycosyltransferase involved in cell wall biosynthesis